MKVNNAIRLLVAFLCVSAEVGAMEDTVTHCGIAEYVYKKTGRTDALYIPYLKVDEKGTTISGDRPLVLDKVEYTGAGNPTLTITNPVFFKKWHNSGGGFLSNNDATLKDRIGTFDASINVNINGINVPANSPTDEYKKLYGVGEKYLIEKDFGANSINFLNISQGTGFMPPDHHMVIPITASMTILDTFQSGGGQVIFYVDEACELKLGKDTLSEPMRSFTDEFYLQNNAKVYPIDANNCELHRELAFYNRADLSSDVEKKYCKGFACFKKDTTISGTQTFNNNQPIFEGTTTINSALLSFGTFK